MVTGNNEGEANESVLDAIAAEQAAPAVDDDTIIYSEATTPEQEELPLGNDPSFLYAGREEKVLEVVHASQRWQFKYKELSWGQKNECIDAAQQWDADTGFKF